MKINYVNSRYAIFVLSLFGFFFSSNLFAQYCSPANINTFNTNYISNVKFADVDNASSGSTGGYTYYSSLSATNIEVGKTLTGTVSITINGWNTQANTLVVWMNFNKNTDNDFLDSGEQFLFTAQDFTNVSGTKTFNVPISIPVPASADLGITRMRIGFRTVNSDSYTSCDYKYAAGEIEDYQINLTTSSTSTLDPTGDHEATYCTPSEMGSFNVNYISEVALGNINKSTTGTTGVYTNYTSTESTDVTIGETITGSVSITLNGWNTNLNTLIVWMNFNESTHDNFDESSERFVFNVQSTSNVSGNKTIVVPISIPVPSTAEVGLSRMRVAFRTESSNSYTACLFGYASGEIEDYQINIISKVEDKDVNTAPAEAMLYFDGVNDYLDTSSFITNWTEATVMGWVKIESDDTGNLPKNYSLFGQENVRLYITKARTPAFLVFTQKQITSGSNYPNNIQVQPASSKNIKMVNDRWYHVAGVFNSSTNTLKLYLNGELVNTTTNSNLNSELLTKNFNGSTHIYSTRGFVVGRYPTNTSTTGSDYFRGNMDEVRIFNKALTDVQLQQMVYQEIENNEGNVKGKILPKDIQDFTTFEKVPWSNLQAYYTMNDITNNAVEDYSNNNHDVVMHNITNLNEQTAPIPYVSQASGDWSSDDIWLHGKVWDVSEIQNKDWAIVHIKNDVTTSISHTNLGLIIDADKTLTVEGDNLIKNTWYLELNGTLDLKDDSQLVQTINSDLVTSATGKLLRRQEGTSNKYRYNNWSSPIGILGATSLIDNNTSSNNTNNTAFKLNMIKDEVGTNLQFTTAYDQVGKISTAWLYTYKNGLTYWDWASLSPSANLIPGVGYTQKGTGNAGVEQQYIFEGKPNNGTILVNVTDKGGSGSVASVSKTEYLLGNPYPSALDINKFIDDNEGIIDGSLLIWQQWAGNSHYLDQYQAGYAQVNKLGSIRASQFIGLEGASTGNQEGTVAPSKYLPVGQAFMTEIIASGHVVFNNSQRVFVKEADADGTYNNGSTFLKSSSSKSKTTTETTEKEQTSEIKKIRLEFNSIEGPEMRREMILGFSETTSDGYDYGYDSECFDSNTNDLNLNFEGKNMNMQAYSAITTDKVVSLNFKSSANNTFEISATEFENIDDTQEIYLRDNTTDTYFNLRQNTAYRFTSEQGKFNTRFEIVFQSKQQSLSAEEITTVQNFIYYQNTSNTLFGKKLSTSIDKLAIVNMRGQIIKEFGNVSQETLSSGLKLNNLASGAYVAWFRAQSGEVFTKKIIVN